MTVDWITLSDTARLITAVIAALAFVWLCKRAVDRQYRENGLYLGCALLFAAGGVDSVARVNHEFEFHLTPIRLSAALVVLVYLVRTSSKTRFNDGES